MAEPPKGLRMPTTADAEPLPDEVAAVTALAEEARRLRHEIGKVIIGQHDVVEQLLTGLFAGGHGLLVGVPGLAKTLLVSTVARILGLSFRRIQFTPDLMPSDITGTDILQDDPETGRRRFAFLAGPIFANIILADEINRTPPKTQAALLEAMQERHVTAGGTSYPLPAPVLRPGHAEPDRAGRDLPAARGAARPLHAQRPRPLPDRLRGAGDPPPDDRRRRARAGDPALGRAIVALQHLVRRVPVAEHVFVYARDLVRASRPNEPEASATVRRCVSWGAGPAPASP